MSFILYNTYFWAEKMAQKAKTPATQSDTLCSILRTHTVGEDQLQQVPSDPPPTCTYNK